MAHLWRNDGRHGDGGVEWAVHPLDADVLVLSAALDAPVLRRHRGPAGECWVLLGPTSVCVNGIALDAGMRVLRDRDELVAGGERVFFSTETAAEVVPMPVMERAASCPRCRLPIDPGTPAVRCPRCRVWYHQSDEYPCFTYAPCALCGEPSTLGAGLQWVPEEGA